MSKLLEWIKANAKDGADFTEAEKLIEAENPLNGIRTNDEALDFIKSNKLLNGGLDKEVRRSNEAALENFTKNKLPGMLSEKEEEIRKSLNPEEDPKDKKIRLLEEKDRERDRKEKENELKALLRNKAAELAKKEDIPYDPLQAERWAQFGEKAEEMLASDIAYHKSNISSVLETKLKGQFQQNPPNRSTTTVADIDAQIKEAKSKGDMDTATRLYTQKQAMAQQ